MSMIEPVQQVPAARPPQPQPAPPPATPSRREIQELWLALSRRAWRTAVLVPADPDGAADAAAAAVALAEVGRRLHPTPVGVLVSARLDYDAAALLVRRVGALHPPGAQDRLVVSIPAVVAEPLGVAVAREADLVVLCLSLGQTGLAAARRTVELIGLDRLAGCLVLAGRR